MVFFLLQKIAYEPIIRVSNVYIFIPTRLKCCKMKTVSCKTAVLCERHANSSGHVELERETFDSIVSSGFSFP